MNQEIEKWLAEHVTELGTEVRKEWVHMQSQTSDPKPHHLLPYEELDGWNKSIDDMIGKAVARFALQTYLNIRTETHD